MPDGLIGLFSGPGNLSKDAKNIVRGNVDHQVKLSKSDTEVLTAWLENPNGSLWLGRLIVEAVEGGGLLIKTRPYTHGATSD